MKYTPLLFLLFFCGCHQEKKNRDYKISQYTPDVLLNAEPLQICEEYSTEVIQQGKEHYVYRDSLLIIRNSKSSGLPYLLFMDLTSNKILKGLKFGNGHNEILSANIALRNETLYVNDYVKSHFLCIDLDRLLSDSTYSPYSLAYTPHDILTIMPFKESYVYLNPWYFHDEDAGIMQGSNRLLLFNSSDSSSKDIDFEYDTWNISSEGILAVIPKNKGIVYASKYQSIIEIYDSNLRLVKQIRGPIDLNMSYSINQLTQDGIKTLTPNQKIPYSYIDCCVDDFYIYFLYVGNYFSNQNPIDNFDTYILKYTWDGELCTAYNYKGFLYSISKGVQKDEFFCSTVREDGNMVLQKLSPQQ